MLPHPVNMIVSLEQRRNDLLAESARERRARLAEQSTSHKSRRPAGRVIAVATLAITLVLLVAASVTAAMVSPVVLP